MLETASSQYRRQAAIASTAAAMVRRTWAKVGVTGDWSSAVPSIALMLGEGMSATVAAAMPYTGAVLAEQNIQAPAVGQLNPQRFTATAPSGAPIPAVADSAVNHGLFLVGEGMPMASAFEQAGSMLVGIALTMLGDTRRSVYAADMISRPNVGGYIRQLSPPSCSRCIILAGRYYRWSAGFQRHPRCDCFHVPTSKAGSRDLIQTPLDAFESLPADQQNATFGKSNARAIRDGADITRVVNVQQRGLSTAIGRSRRPRRYATMTVDDIYRIAGSRTNAIALLKAQGYLIS